jgi:hypothetical protein
MRNLDATREVNGVTASVAVIKAVCSVNAFSLCDHKLCDFVSGYPL